MTSPARKQARGLVVNLILVALAFGLLGLTIWQNWERIQRVFHHRPDYRIFGLALLVYLMGTSLSFLRWYILVRVIEPRFRFGSALLLGFIGNVFNLVIPGAVGGDVIKAAYLVRMDINRTQAVASMVIDRIVGLLGLFLLAGGAGIAAWRMNPPPSPQVRLLIMIVWGAVIAGFLLLTAIFAQTLTRSFPSLTRGERRFSKILRELMVMSTTYRRRLDVVAACLGISVAIHFAMVIGFYGVSRAILPSGVPSFGQHLLMVPLTLFTTAVPLPFGALGLSEQVSDQLFRLVHHPEGALAMLGFRVLMYSGGLISAGVYLVNFRQVRSLTRTVRLIEEEPETG
ncbi:MAG: hypothetical protein NVSMB9_09500 [Isosphaeraceae bacterium]